MPCNWIHHHVCHGFLDIILSDYLRTYTYVSIDGYSPPYLHNFHKNKTIIIVIMIFSQAHDAVLRCDDALFCGTFCQEYHRTSLTLPWLVLAPSLLFLYSTSYYNHYAHLLHLRSWWSCRGTLLLKYFNTYIYTWPGIYYWRIHARIIGTVYTILLQVICTLTHEEHQRCALRGAPGERGGWFWSSLSSWCYRSTIATTTQYFFYYYY